MATEREWNPSTKEDFMSVDIQLELNIDNRSVEDVRADIMQKQMDAIHESLTKTRKKLFAEVGNLKKLLGEILIENDRLKDALSKTNHEKVEWIYKQEDSLFDVKEKISI